MTLRLALAVALVLGIAACKGSEAPPTQLVNPNAKRVDESKAGGITGKVAYEGPAPENRTVKVDSDPACAKEHPNGVTIATTIVNNGALENVFVYVKEGLPGDYVFDTPTQAVTLDQKGCTYTPHVFGVRVGQPVEIVNSDSTLHNVHALAQANREFNFPQAITGMKQAKTFTAPEIMVHFKCDVHNWMSAYVGVVAHPYFAVTGNAGTFELKNLPAGTYTIEAWHEKLGTQTQSVTIGEKESKPITFTFKAATT